MVGRDLDLVRRHLAPGRRVIVLSSDATTPAELAAAAGRGRLRAECADRARRPGRPAESRSRTIAADADRRGRRPGPQPGRRWSARPSRALVRSARAAGLPDDAFEHDGQLTKRDLRASALARLAPLPGQLLWDVGAGAGSIAIEWARTIPRCRAIAVEPHPERAARIPANAARLGVPGVQVVTADVHRGAGRAAAAGRDLRRRRRDLDVIRRCWHALPAGGRLVVHAVTAGDRADPARGLARARRRADPDRGRARWSRWVASPAGNRPGRWSSGAREARPEPSMTVHFIGAGPGAADLLTVRAVRLLAASPVCVYAGTYLDAEVLSHCPPDATLIDTPGLDPRRDHRAPGRPRTGPARTSPGCARATRRSTRRWPSRPVGSTGPASRGT